MEWRNKIEQLVGLLKKVPQPKTFELKEGVYEPYFTIEIRAGNWEVVPHASYTRLDGNVGRDIRLSLSTLDSSKVNISQEELNCLLYLQSNSFNSHPVFSYAQPVGFLLEWLRNSNILIKDPAQRVPTKISYFPDEAKIMLRLIKQKSGYLLQPCLNFADKIINIDKTAIILSSNPIYMLYDFVFYKINSVLPAIFWNNYFRVQQKFDIPHSDIEDFIRLYLPHILPVLDWQNLADHFDQVNLPMTRKKILLSEENGQLQIDAAFQYRRFEFPLYMPVDRSLVNTNDHMLIVQRDLHAEKEARSFLEEHGLIYRAGHWHIASDYYVLDWMRNVIPKLQKAGFEISGEEGLRRFRVHRQTARLKLKVNLRGNQFDFKYGLFAGNKALQIPDLIKQIQIGKQYVKLADGSQIYLQENLREKIKEFTFLLDLSDGSGKLRLPAAGVVLLKELKRFAQDFVLDRQSQTLLQKFEAFEKINTVEPPCHLKGELRKYQKSGLDWLFFLNKFHFGGILADDMGLGKTVQVISLLLKLKELNRLIQPALIVMPLTLIFNWKQEIEKFAPGLNVLVYSGNRRDRQKQLNKVSKYDVILCSYGIALQDQHFLTEEKYSYLILDESQKIKNPETKTYRAVSRIKAPHKMALTGTPVENSLVDLWAQLSFLNPGLLGNITQFEKRFVDIPPEEKDDKIKALKKLIFPFILRRTKQEVETQLPPLTEVVHYIEMTEHQRQIYQKWLRYYRDEIFFQIENKGLNKSKLKILEALTYLRQLACHPAIFDETTELGDSGKMQLLDDMLEAILIKGHKVLIFSQFVRFLKIVRQFFDNKSLQYEYLDGKVRNRAQKIKNFQENQNIAAFLISLKAGGLGVNLTAADYVIHLDPWWNPAVERQATDRAHRIGQEKHVFVYKYIVKNSVEEKILTLQQKKKELSDKLITSDSTLIKQLTRKDLELLFELS
jgi:non-specific serine/threonine protein kinase